MPQSFSIAAAPVSWGVFEAESEVPATEFLDDVTAAGYEGTELGPVGYLGSAEQIRDELGKRDLALVGAFLPLPLSRPELKADNQRETNVLLNLLEAATDRPPIVLLSDAYDNPDSIAAAGRVDETPDVWLADEDWKVLLEQIADVASLCRSRGFDVAFHPHGGSFVETAREVDRLLAGVDTQAIGLCLDTGHCFFGGDDPKRLIRDHGSIIRWVHLKDVDLDVMNSLKRDGFGIEEAWRQGVFCALGEGGVDIEGVVQGLGDAGYDDWIVVEQDRVLGHGGERYEVAADARRNVEFLRYRGL
jgi:inosose dehydratase